MAVVELFGFVFTSLKGGDAFSSLCDVLSFLHETPNAIAAVRKKIIFIDAI